MNILMIASEAAPYLRTSGVANVVVELSSELRQQGHDVRLVIPHYRSLSHTEGARLIIKDVNVPLGLYQRRADIWKLDLSALQNLPVYFLGNDFYFGRKNAFGYLDDYERFIFFTLGVLKMLQSPEWKVTEGEWHPDVIHGHDWFSGLVPFWLNARDCPESASKAAFVCTLHNAGFPGQFTLRALQMAGLQHYGVYDELGETDDFISFMARGIWLADAVSTVSPTHAQELMSGCYPFGVNPALHLRKEPISGILNAIDCALYNPDHDDDLWSRFNAFEVGKRQINKLGLQKECGLENNASIPLLGVVTRLIPEKGVGLLADAIPNLLEANQAQFVVLGALGDYHYQEFFARLGEQFKNRLKAFFEFNERRARRIFAAADAILIPSQYEPCGLQQLIAMHYGAIPLVHKTGGLADTVAPWDSNSSNGRGFVFERFDEKAFLEAINSALTLFRTEPATWARIQRHNMRLDFSWSEPAGQYVELYEKAVKQAELRHGMVNAAVDGPGSRPGIAVGRLIRPDPNQLLTHTLLEATELASIADKQDYLAQTGRNIRELLACDAVFIWVEDEEAQHLLRLAGSSFAENRRPVDCTPPETIRAERHARSWSPQYVYRRTPGSDGSSSRLGTQLGFLASELATKLGWQVQVTVPMNVRGMVEGRIEAFFTDSQRTIGDREISALGAIANALASNLENLREHELSALLLAADREMSAASSVQQVTEVLGRYSKQLLHADGAVVRIKGVEQLDATTESVLANHRSQIKIELRAEDGEHLGELLVWRERFGGFSEQDDITLKELARQTSAFLLSTRQREGRDRNHAEKLRRLSDSLTGLGELDPLLQSVVETTAEVLAAEAASLYLVDASGELLQLKAAAGYHTLLRSEPAPTYKKGQGMTGWIWEKGERFRADSLERLHEHPAWKGLYRHLQKSREPMCFLGLPLKAIERSTGREKVIGVLKLEDRLERPGVSPFFNDEDERLATMMANVIATVVYNTQLSENRLQELSRKLGSLSSALVGSQGRTALMEAIVQKLTEVVNVDAASLYLADVMREKLVIEAASGYQRELTKADPKPFYHWGEGVTGRIAKDNRAIKANSLAALRAQGGSQRGRWDHLQGNAGPESFYGLPLNVSGEEKPIGVLKVESLRSRPFTEEDVLLLEMMGNVIAAVVHNAKVSENKLAKLSSDVRELSEMLTGSEGRQALMRAIVEKIREVIRVDAASLFLADDKRERLRIEAASGYQAPLMDAEPKPFYRWGEGVTGRIARDNKPFKADSKAELRARGGSRRGLWDQLQGDLRPESFYGLPLNVRGQEKPIGVLKVESLAPRPFTAEDVLLLEMMGNIIAVVVYNVQFSESRLARFSENLKRLSDVLTPGRQKAQELFQTIVDTISAVFDTDAASLYLLDQSTKRLVVAASSGYQRPLIKGKAFYELGEGVTGRIGKTGESVRANTLEQLRSRGTSRRGKYDRLQGGNQPRSFYGVPLKVTDRVIGVLKFESLKEGFFSDETCLLIDMVANVIATVIHNSQQGEERIGDVLSQMGMLSARHNASHDVLLQYAKETDAGLTNQLAKALASELGKYPAVIENEAFLIFEARKGSQPSLPEIFERISNWAKFYQYDRIAWQYALYEAILSLGLNLEEWTQVQKLAAPWIQLRESATSAAAFAQAADELIAKFTSRLQVGYSPGQMDRTESWYTCELETKDIFGDQVKKLLLLFQRQGDLEATQLEVLSKAGDVYPVLLTVLWNVEPHQTRLGEVRDQLKGRSVDVAFVRIKDILTIMHAPVPNDSLRSLVLKQATIVSPFITMGAVPETLFFGRDSEIKTLTHNPALRDYAIVGNRRIGKSSLMHRVYSILKSNSEVLPLKIDCQPVKNQEDFFLRFQARTHLELPENSVAGFEQCMKQLKQEGRTPVLLLDEVDNLFADEELTGETLICSWRSLAQDEKTCRFLFFGSGVLARQVANTDSKLHNFPEPLPLGYLSAEAANRVLTEPLDKLEVELEEHSALTEEVLRLTSCHPCLVQSVGKRLVEMANLRGERRIVLSDVHAIGESAGFRDSVLDTIWGTVGPLEKLITLLTDTPEFRLQEIEAALARRGVIIDHRVPGPKSRRSTKGVRVKTTATVLRRALKMLQFFSILEETHQLYRFIPQSFYTMIQSLPDNTLADYIEQAISKLQATMPKD
ncbi:MAG: GAF domain-containing protein [Acidobacteria bacterium]|nr:MAG: GAF domain-containing protein [Acidobacteriota bacterium]